MNISKEIIKILLKFILIKSLLNIFISLEFYLRMIRFLIKRKINEYLLFYSNYSRIQYITHILLFRRQFQ